MIPLTRIAQLGALVVVGGLSAGAGLLVSAGGGAGAPPSGQTSTSTSATLPDQVPVEGPNGYEGTVPRSVFTDPPPLTAALTPPAPADYPGASIVLNDLAGYAVMNNGKLSGYWVPGHQPGTYVSVADAEAEGAVSSHGASPVGTTTAVTPSPADNPVPTTVATSTSGSATTSAP